MADTTKHITNLDFDIEKANQQLQDLSKIVNSFSSETEKKFENVGKAIEKGLKNVNTSNITSNLQKVNETTLKQQQELQNDLVKLEAKKEADISKITEKGLQNRLTSDTKTINRIKIEREKYSIWKEKQAEKDARTAEKQAEREAKATEKAEAKKAAAIKKQQEDTKTALVGIAGAAIGITTVDSAFQALKRTVSETIEEMKGVEYRMMEISRIMEDGSINVNDYRDQLIDLASRYGRSFDDVSAATLNFARAGFDAQESLKLTEQAMLALNTAELDANQATDGLVAVMAQWGYNTGTATEQAEKLGSVIDKINKVADNFPLESADILEALQRVSQGFALSGATIDETIAMIVAAEKEAQRGGKIIGTAMANMVQQLKAEKKLDLAEQLGLNFYTDETKQEFKSVTKIFEEMSDRMEQLKKDGKESSVEMQQLLELFTVFRRNIGAGLLSEMAGEDSTYAKALETSLNAVGYSAQENSKYMSTMTAQSQTLKDELLKLKTEVWDGGLEDAAKGAISTAREIIQGIKFVTENISKLNSQLTALIANATGNEKSAKNILGVIKLIGATLSGGTGVLAGLSGTKELLGAVNAEQETAIKRAENFSSVSKNVETLAKSYEDTITSYNQLRAAGADTSKQEEELLQLEKSINETLQGTGKSVEIINKNVNNQGKLVNEVNKDYREQLDILRTIADENEKMSVAQLEAAVKQAQASRGYTLSKEDKTTLRGSSLNNAEIKAFNNMNFEQQVAQLQKWEQELEAAASQGKNVSGSMAVMENALTTLYGQQTKVNEVTKQYKDALEALYSSGLTMSLEQYNDALTQIQNNYKNESISKYISGIKSLNNQFIDGKINATEYFSSLNKSIKEIDLEGTAKTIPDYVLGLDESRLSIADVGEELKNFNERVEQNTEKLEDNKLSIRNVNEEMANLRSQQQGTAEEMSEQTEEFQAIFAATTKSVAEGMEIIQNQFENGQIGLTEYITSMQSAGQTTLDLYTKSNELTLNDGQWVDAAGNVDNYANSLQSAVEGLNGMNGIVESLLDNTDFLMANLDEFGNLAIDSAQVGTEAYQNFANSFIDSLNAMRDSNYAAFEDIVNAAANAAGTTADAFLDANGYVTDSIASEANVLNAGVNAATSSVGQALGNLTSSAGRVMSALGRAISNFRYNIDFIPTGNLKFNPENLLNGGQLFTGSLGLKIAGHGGGSINELGSAITDFGSQLSNISPVVANVGDILSKGRARSYGGGGSGTRTPSSYSPSSGGSGGSGGSGNRGSSGSGSSTTEKNTILQDFKDAISEREKEEQRWVKKQKELNQLSLDDQKYILQQEISRYKTYADEVMRLNGVTEEEKLKVRKEYLQKAEDLEMDYMDVLKEQLDEQINEIKNKYDERIDKINEAADEEIEALRKVEKENDRIREKEEYLERRNEILHGYQGVEYWEQRTGRAAQLALAEARKNLQDLDKDWEEKQESWNADDQIAAIEARRDADIEAAYAQRDAEIAAIQATYDYRVKQFAETGQLIYDQATIQSKNLFNTYKRNFIDPVGTELQRALSQQAQAQSQPAPSRTTDYLIQWGDTLTSIANRFGTTIAKIMAANPSITNPNLIYAGRTLKIPQSHTGSKVIGDGIVELQKGEVVLNTKWARDLDRMLEAYSGRTSKGNSTINNGSTINVRGDMMKIEATLEDKSDINILARKVKKTLEKQFSIN